MTTKLTTPVKREIEIDGRAYVVTIAVNGVVITEKRRRTGREFTWRALLAAGAPTSTASHTTREPSAL